MFPVSRVPLRPRAGHLATENDSDNWISDSLDWPSSGIRGRTFGTSKQSSEQATTADSTTTSTSVSRERRHGQLARCGLPVSAIQSDHWTPFSSYAIIFDFRHLPDVNVANPIT